MSRNYSNKNLTELEMGNIEFYLNVNKSFTEIGRLLKRNEGTIRKEIKNILHILALLENVRIVLTKIIATKNIYAKI
ncbi:MAG: helix-turn-helix domain-containing protein [Bacilli bacterium]|nr:helix-turn-helix domain-containing protein [Bacilli bacterium]